MKKIKYIALICLICLSFVMTCCGEKTLHIIDYQDLASKFKKEDTFVLYLGSSQCSHCMEFKPTLERVIADNSLDVYYIDLAKVSEEQYKEIAKKTGLEGTPTIVYVEKGVVDRDDDKRIVGTKDEEETTDYFKTIGLIKKTKDKKD